MFLLRAKSLDLQIFLLAINSRYTTVSFYVHKNGVLQQGWYVHKKSYTAVEAFLP